MNWSPYCKWFAICAYFAYFPLKWLADHSADTAESTFWWRREAPSMPLKWHFCSGSLGYCHRCIFAVCALADVQEQAAESAKHINLTGKLRTRPKKQSEIKLPSTAVFIRNTKVFWEKNTSHYKTKVLQMSTRFGSSFQTIPSIEKSLIHND